MHTNYTPPPEQYPECWRDALTLLQLSPRVALFGPPGTGKTFAAMTTAPRAFRVMCTGDGTTGDLLGGWQPTASGAWHYREGVIVRAMREGARVVLDEVDRASGDQLSALLLAADSPESITWENPETFEIVRPAEGYSCVFTTNLEDWYRLDAALRDRMVAPVRINTPHPVALDRLPAHFRTLAAQTADRDRDERVSLRAWLEVANLAPIVGEREALRLVLGDERAETIALTLAVEASTLAGASYQ